MRLRAAPATIFAVLLLAFPSAPRANPSSNGVLGYCSVAYQVKHNDCWGFVKNGREYAVVGGDTATNFIDITKPTNPVLIKQISRPYSPWGSFKRYGDYIYGASEAANGLQIIDISNPLDPTLVRTWNTTFTNSHDIAIDTTAARLYAVGTQNGMRVLNLAIDPSNPADIGGYTSAYLHDIYVRNGIGYAGAIYAGQLRLLNVTNASNITTISSVSYPNSFTHNAWPTEDGLHCFTTDENAGGHIRAWDINPPTSPLQVADAYAWTPGAIVHNVYVKGDTAYSAYYTAGFVMHNIEDPENPELIGWYDTSIFDGETFKGAWGAYPWLPSGNIIVSNIGGGLSVVRPCGQLNHENGWPLAVPGTITGAATLANLEGDGASEIVVASTNDSVYVFRGDGTRVPGWPRFAGGDVIGSVAIGDLTGDGDLEIVAGAMNGALTAWDAAGALVAGWPVATGAAVEATPALADLDADGSLEVVVASGSQLRAYRASGALLAGFPVALSGSVGARGAAVGDIDGDGPLEIVQATSTTLHAFRANGAVVAGWPKASAGATSSLRRAPILADLDGDSDLEIVIGGGSGAAGSVEAYHGSGAAVAGWPRAASAECGGALAAGDIDGDGAADVVAVAADGRVHAWRGDGVALAGWPAGGGGSAGSSPVLADIDADGAAEVFVATADSVLRIYRGDGTARYACQPDLTQSVEGAIALGATDADAPAEIFIPQKGGTVMAFALHDAGAALSRADWPGYRFGNRRLGVRDNTFPGANVSVALGASVIAQFDAVGDEGYTQVRRDALGAPALPPGYRAFGDSIAYFLTSSARTSDSARVTVVYDATGLSPAQEAAIALLAFDGAAWSDVTESRDANANTITGRAAASGLFAALLSDPTDVPLDPASNAAASFAVWPASPNPTRGASEIRFRLPAEARVTLSVYDVSGALVRRLADERLRAGDHLASWDGRNAAGVEVSSGVYFYRLEAGPRSESRRLAIVR